MVFSRARQSLSYRGLWPFGLVLDKSPANGASYRETSIGRHEGHYKGASAPEILTPTIHYTQVLKGDSQDAFLCIP